MRKIAIHIALVLLAGVAHAGPPNPYAEQRDREIKALSNEEVQSYLAGKGMGLARAAELNGHPGPSHVLSLARDLELTPEQEAQTRALFAQMERLASSLGKQLVAQERNLDELFASKSATPALLASATERIGLLQGQIRNAHLAAHIAQVAILTPAQTARYNELRGYTKAANSAHDAHAFHGHR